MPTIIWAFSESWSFCNSTIKDHRSWIIRTNIVRMKKVWNISRNTTLWYRGTKWENAAGQNGADRLVQCRAAINLQFVKKAVSVKRNKKRSMSVCRMGWSEWPLSFLITVKEWIALERSKVNLKHTEMTPPHPIVKGKQLFSPPIQLLISKTYHWLKGKSHLNSRSSIFIGDGVSF